MSALDLPAADRQAAGLQFVVSDGIGEAQKVRRQAADSIHAGVIELDGCAGGSCLVGGLKIRVPSGRGGTMVRPPGGRVIVLPISTWIVPLRRARMRKSSGP